MMLLEQQPIEFAVGMTQDLSQTLQLSQEEKDAVWAVIIGFPDPRGIYQQQSQELLGEVQSAGVDVSSVLDLYLKLKTFH